MTHLATCIGCGCDDFHACPGGCWWLRVDPDNYLRTRKDRKGVCSRCADHLDAWDRGDRTEHAEPVAEREAIDEGRDG